MTSKILSLTAALILMGHSTTALAQEFDSEGYYMSPEDILLQEMNDGTRARNARASDALAELQQQRTVTYKKQQEELHAAAEAEEKAQAEAAAQEEESNEEDTGTVDTTKDSDGASIQLTPEELRLFMRLKQPRTLQSTAGLHEGAPLAPSGLPEVATVVILSLAVGWTLWRAKKAEIR